MKTPNITRSPWCATALVHPRVSARLDPLCALARSLVPKHDLNRPNRDDQVKENTVILNIIQVVGEFRFGILNRGAVRIVDLGPAGDAGTHAQTLAVVGNFARQSLDEEGPFRTRPDEAHVTTQDIENLRNFVDSGEPEEAAD